MTGTVHLIFATIFQVTENKRKIYQDSSVLADNQRKKQNPRISGGFIFKRDQFLESVSVALLALHLTPTAYGFGLFAFTFFRGFLVITTHLHFAEYAFTLQLLLQNAQRLIDVIVAYIDRYQTKSPLSDVT